MRMGYIKRYFILLNVPTIDAHLDETTFCQPKTWEPFLRYLTSTASEEYYVAEAWSLEAVQHGDSAIVNADNLGLVCMSFSYSISSQYMSSNINHPLTIISFHVLDLPSRLLCIIISCIRAPGYKLPVITFLTGV